VFDIAIVSSVIIVVVYILLAITNRNPHGNYSTDELDWFVDDDRANNRMSLPVTKRDIIAIRQQVRGCECLMFS
jgi:hypothetical protein